MLIEKDHVIKINDKDNAVKVITDKCDFVNSLKGVYFKRNSENILFDAVSDGEKLKLYCRNTRTLFKPVVVIDFSRKYITLKIQYSMTLSVLIVLLSLLLLSAGIVSIHYGYTVSFFLPLMVFWLWIFVSFSVNSGKIIKEFDELLE